MIQSKVIIFGQITREVGNKMYIRRGDVVDVYNTDYYRVVPWELHEEGEKGANENYA
jgi:hypothetical protein